MFSIISPFIDFGTGFQHFKEGFLNYWKSSQHIGKDCLSKNMSIRLEPLYLANVLLFIKDNDTTKAFPLVSKRCHVAALTLKRNPEGFTNSPDQILRFFPNINTMVVATLSCFEGVQTLPDTVTSIVVKKT